jgi:predicted nucleic acid-binding protein
MNIFIDTNVLLSFYSYQEDDLEELKKLLVMLEQKKLNLYLPQQVIDEFQRNRENKIFESLTKLKDQTLNLKFPQICKFYSEYDELRKLQNEYEQAHTSLINKLLFHIKIEALRPDSILLALIQEGNRIRTSDKIIESARLRRDIGNPPGKDHSLGDAINWESLLLNTPSKQDLHFISGDKDYFSAIDNDLFNPFLLKEWQSRKDSQLFFYKRISTFFKAHFPNIRLAHELEKELLIDAFTKSSSFTQTHDLVDKLADCDEFSNTQLDAIVLASISNSQIRMIINDSDVNELLWYLIEGHEGALEKSNLDKLLSILKPLEPLRNVGDDDLPF